jgi:S1-C subfamily serine protease
VSKGRLATAAAVISVILLLSGCGGSTTSTVTVTTSAARAHQKPLVFATLVARVRSGIVRIETTTCDGSGEIGTGILVSPRLVATVEHVIDGAVSIDLKQNGKVVGYGTVIGSDPARDVALVRSDRPIAGYRFSFANGPPVLGEDVAAIGFPLGLPLTVTRGTVSGSDRTIPINGVKRTQLIQTDAPVNPGNSGGPLMTNSGRIVGLVDLGTDQANGLAFAVSSGVAAPLIQGWTFAPQSTPANCSTPTAQATPTTQTQTTGSSPQNYVGGDFAIEYPAGWVVSHIPEGGGNRDTTFAPPGGGGSGPLMRVDENPNAGGLTPQAAAAPVIAALERDPSYVNLGITQDTFNGLPSLRWEFQNTVGGVVMHKVDEFFTDSSGHGWGVLIQAPQSLWPQDGAALESYLATLQPA